MARGISKAVEEANKVAQRYRDLWEEERQKSVNLANALETAKEQTRALHAQYHGLPPDPDARVRHLQAQMANLSDLVTLWRHSAEERKAQMREIEKRIREEDHPEFEQRLRAVELDVWDIRDILKSHKRK